MTRMEKYAEQLFMMASDNDPVGNSRIAAAVLFRNKIVSYGFNKQRSHPLQKRFRKNTEAIYLHAEIDAIKNSLRRITVDDLTSATLLIVRSKFNSNGGMMMGLAKPCCGCAKCIAHFNIKRVIYSDVNGKVKEFT